MVIVMTIDQKLSACLVYFFRRSPTLNSQDPPPPWTDAILVKSNVILGGVIDPFIFLTYIKDIHDCFYIG